jgi:hypothetical protein
MPAQVNDCALEDVFRVVGMERLDKRVGRFVQVDGVVALDWLVPEGDADQ